MAETKEVATRSEASPAEASRRIRPMVPSVDIYEDEEGIVLLADMPGVSKDGLELKIDKNVLHIRGEISQIAGEEVSPLYAEFVGKEYYRAFTLGPEVDQDKIQATMSGGVLRLFLPKVEAEKPRKIEIKVG
ncbi:Hsp20/alpha crystallin family protein [Thermosulfuriphilus sp.]